MVKWGTKENHAIEKAVYEGSADDVRALIASGGVDVCARVPMTGDLVESLLHIACRNKDADVVAVLLAAGAVADETNSRGSTPLFAACEHKNVDAVKKLLAAGAAVNQVRDINVTPLYIASQFGCGEAVSALLDAGATIDFESTPHNSTPLQIAAYDGHTDALTRLLAAGASIEHRTKEGSTPLYNAVEQKHPAAVKALLEAGAAPDAVRLCDGSTPLFCASHNGQVEIAEALIAAGAPVDQLGTQLSPLFMASQQGHLPIVVALLAAGAPVDYSGTKDNCSPLFIACQQDHTEIAAALIGAGADVLKASDKGVAPLFLAAKKGNMTTVKALLDAKASVDQTMANGRTPLYSASSQGHAEVVSALLDAGAKLDLTRDDSNASLCLACSKGFVDVVELLMARGAKVDLTDKEGNTPLIYAATAGEAKVVRVLIDAKADIEFTNESEGPMRIRTPMLTANSAEVLDILARAGAQIDRRGTTGISAMGMACSNGKIDRAQILSYYGASRTFVGAPPPVSTAEKLATLQRHNDLLEYLQVTRDCTTPLQHIACVPNWPPFFDAGERCFALLRGGADILAGGKEATPLFFARRMESTFPGFPYEPTRQILEAAKPWSRHTHKLFPAPARARAVELMLVGELLSREERFAAYGPVAVVDAWMAFVVPKAVSRNRVQVGGLKGRPELNGQEATIGELDEAKGRYPVTFEGGETVLIKALNLCSVRDDAADAKEAATVVAPPSDSRQEMVGKFNELMRMCEKIKAQLGLPADITRVADILKAANEKVGVPAEGTLVEQAERLIAATRDAVDAE